MGFTLLLQQEFHSKNHKPKPHFPEDSASSAVTQRAAGPLQQAVSTVRYEDGISAEQLAAQKLRNLQRV
jgi:hypothetical protein